jgi:Holliday junction resolvase RusA-like endonuclease
MSEGQWYVLDLNPIQWAVGPVVTGRRGGKIYGNIGRNQELHAYKEAVGELLEDIAVLVPGEVELHMYFWRQREEYQTHQARTHRKHEADLTNLQKALEDALQDSVIQNDKNVKAVRVVVVEQDTETTPCVVFKVEPWQGFNPDELPTSVWMQVELLNISRDSHKQLTIQDIIE